MILFIILVMIVFPILTLSIALYILYRTLEDHESKPYDPKTSFSEDKNFTL